jgi:hypothetical protein
VSAVLDSRAGVDWTHKVTRRFCGSVLRRATSRPRARRKASFLSLREPCLDNSRRSAPRGRPGTLKEGPHGSQVVGRAARLAQLERPTPGAPVCPPTDLN